MADIFNYKGVFCWFVLIMLGGGFLVGILLSYFEEYILVESTCQLIDIVETKRTMTCDVITSQKSFKCIKAAVSLNYLNQTCRRAMLFRSLSNAEETKFQCSTNECDGPWDVNKFVSGLGNSGQLRCSYNLKIQVELTLYRGL